ncbi:MAG: hypothetical protein NDJ19_11855 [Ramlibacter sp.]|nr:hypothetical protein [Ramlibacter sp.]
MSVRRGLHWLLLVALLSAQMLGLMHHVVHGPKGDSGLATQRAHEDERHGPEWVSGLFSGHDDEDPSCRVIDQSGHGDVLPVLPAVPLPLIAPSCVLRWFPGEVLARWAAVFDARGPPLLR